MVDTGKMFILCRDLDADFCAVMLLKYKRCRLFKNANIYVF